MSIAVLCILSCLATALAWLYLAYQEQSTVVSKNEGADDESAISKKIVFRPARKRLAFLIMMLLSLCAVAVELTLVFSGNTLIQNAKLLTLVAVIFVAANVDARQRIIPNAVVLTGVVFRIVFWLLELMSVPDAFWDIMKNDLLACLLVVAFFVVGVLIIKGGIGMGDIKLMLVMCLFQGFYGVVSSLFCSLFVAFIYAIIALLFKRKNKTDSVAFAPAILIGTIVSVMLSGM